MIQAALTLISFLLLLPMAALGNILRFIFTIVGTIVISKFFWWGTFFYLLYLESSRGSMILQRDFFSIIIVAIITLFIIEIMIMIFSVYMEIMIEIFSDYVEVINDAVKTRYNLLKEPFFLSNIYMDSLPRFIRSNPIIINTVLKNIDHSLIPKIFSEIPATLISDQVIKIVLKRNNSIIENLPFNLKQSIFRFKQDKLEIIRGFSWHTDTSNSSHYDTANSSHTDTGNSSGYSHDQYECAPVHVNWYDYGGYSDHTDSYHTNTDSYHTDTDYSYHTDTGTQYIDSIDVDSLWANLPEIELKNIVELLIKSTRTNAEQPIEYTEENNKLAEIKAEVDSLRVELNKEGKRSWFKNFLNR